MKISYNWLKEYLPQHPAFDSYINDVNSLAVILTSVGLEVENIEKYESVKGGLAGLLVAEVLSCEKHPDADKLKVTVVNTGSENLQIVCGAPNVAAGQKVVLAPVGSVLFPLNGESFAIKKAKIRGVASEGMLCAEDEIGIGKSHDGIIVLPEDARPGISLSEIFPVYNDFIIEIGLTPNRMDAQSHLGVAKDVCAWLTYHIGTAARVVSPLGKSFAEDNRQLEILPEVKDPKLSPRYAGVSITNVTIGTSPEWLQQKLKTIGLKPINNVVDITNYILHTTGQPLHAFDADIISRGKVIVETLPAGTTFTTLDGKERKLFGDDIMICDGNHTPMCIAGVFGGEESGVSDNTKNLFLESAVFNPAHIRQSMIAHGLRTDAAVRFEKGVDISKTVEVLQYAAQMITELAGGNISSAVSDIYQGKERTKIDFSLKFLKRLSGKTFEKDAVIKILQSLNFLVEEKNEDILSLQVPFSNPDITLPADVVEEVLRISGLDAVEIPRQVTMTPGSADHQDQFSYKEKITGMLVGNGFSEIFTNSISNKLYFKSAKNTVEIINSLSEELTVLRPEMLPTALESIAYNLNRQNKNLLLFEFGKTYGGDAGTYHESNHLSVYCTGEQESKSWNLAAKPCDIFFAKGIAEGLFQISGIAAESTTQSDNGEILHFCNGKRLGKSGSVDVATLDAFSIKQPVYYIDLDFDILSSLALRKKTVYTPVSKFPVVSRDLSMIIDKNVPYSEIEANIRSLKLRTLKGFRIFDLYDSDKLGENKKSIAMNFSFSDPQKTLTDKETDKLMNQIMRSLDEKLNVQIRSHA